MIAGVNKAYILPFNAVEVIGAAIIVKDGYTWEEIPIQRDSSKYECDVKLTKFGKKSHHSATMDILTCSAADEYAWREKARTRHIVALVLNTNETVIVGVEAPARLAVSPYTSEKPEDESGISLNFECDSRNQIEEFNGKLTLNIVTGFGNIYNSFAANMELIKGWRIPTIDDLHDIATTIGYPFDSGLESLGGGLLKETSAIYWDSPNEGATNQFGISIIGSGVREEVFFGKKEICKLWCAGNVTLFFYKDYSSMTVYGDVSWRGASIRLVKSVSEVVKVPKFITDFDGNSYPVIRIGNTLITASDFRSTKSANGNSILNITDNTEWMELTTPAYCTYNNE